MCFVCGMKNIAGVKVFFYEQDDDTLLARFCGQDIHQGYPGRFHGGVLAGIMDETLGRTIRIRHGEQGWGVTAELTLRYRQPVPLGIQLEAIGRLTRETRRLFEAEGQLLLPDGTVAVEAHGKFIKLPPEALGEFDPQAEEWRVWPD